MDPFLRDPHTIAAMDDAGYRARRIFMPLVSSVLGFGNPAVTLNVFASINYVFFLILLVALIVVLRPADRVDWAAVAAVALTTGSLDSLHRSLSDLPVSTLIFIAVMLPLAATRIALLAVAMLTRETAVLSAVPCVLASPLFDRRNFLRLTMVLLPAVLWFAYLFIHLQNLGRRTGRQFPNARRRHRAAPGPGLVGVACRCRMIAVSSCCSRRFA